MAGGGDLTGPLQRAFDEIEANLARMDPDDGWTAANEVGTWVERHARRRAALIRARAAMRVRDARKLDIVRLGAHLNMSTARAGQLRQLARDGDAQGEG
jgi:hypothetical protein